MAEFFDIETLWEQRFLQVAEPFLDPKPNMVEGGRLAEWEDGALLGVTVTYNFEEPVGNHFWNATVLVEYLYEQADGSEAVSRTWGQILEAFGDGHDGADPLRTRLPDGRLDLMNGLQAVRYDGPIRSDLGIKTWEFTANLGEQGSAN